MSDAAARCQLGDIEAGLSARKSGIDPDGQLGDLEPIREPALGPVWNDSERSSYRLLIRFGFRLTPMTLVHRPFPTLFRALAF